MILTKEIVNRTIHNLIFFDKYECIQEVIMAPYCKKANGRYTKDVDIFVVMDPEKRVAKQIKDYIAILDSNNSDAFDFHFHFFYSYLGEENLNGYPLFSRIKQAS